MLDFGGPLGDQARLLTQRLGRAAVFPDADLTNANAGGLTRLVAKLTPSEFYHEDFEALVFIVISNAERQERWRAERDAKIEAVRAATTKAALALAQAENDLLRQHVLDLETALARRESALRSAQTKATSEVARLKEKNKELQSQLRQTWDWYNNEITNAGGLTFKASSLMAKALHPDATPSEEVRLEAFKAFSAWKGDRDAARRR